MNNGIKVLLAVLLAVYVVSPVDLMPGTPIDDIILVLFTIASSRKIGKKAVPEGSDDIIV